LENLQEIVQEIWEEMPPSIVIASPCTMTGTTLVGTSSLDFSQEHFCDFEKYTTNISSKLLRYMGYDGKGLGKTRQRILSPVVSTSWFKHEGLGFNGRKEEPVTRKTIFVKAKYMPKLVFSLGEGVVAISERGNPLPRQPSCAKLKEGNNEKRS